GVIAFGATVAGNAGPNSGFDTTSGYAILGANQTRFSPGEYKIAVPFTPASSALLGQILIPLGELGSSGSSTVNITIENDSAGLPSGTIVESIPVSGIPVRAQMLMINSSAHSLLLAGTKYWLVATAATADSQVQWNRNSTSDVGAWAVFQG